MAVSSNTTTMEEEFFGYSDLDVSAKHSKLSDLIQCLEDEITFLESDQGCAAATVVLSSEERNMSESEIELSEDELETLVPEAKEKEDEADNKSEDNSDLDNDELAAIESEERAIEECNDSVTETVEITSVTSETEIAASEAVRSEPESAVAATATDTVPASNNISDEIASAVLTDILNFVTTGNHVKVQSKVNPKPNERPSRLATEVKTLVSEVPRMEELKADSIVVGGRTLRARTSTTPAPLTGSRSRNSSGDSNTSQSRRSRTSSAVETIAERRQSRASVEADTNKEEGVKTNPVPEGRVLRRRHNSNDSGKSDHQQQPARKTRSVRSVSTEQADQSSRESTPSVVSGHRLSPRNRSPARGKSPGRQDSIVVNLPRKKKKKDVFDGKARAEADILKRISELQSQGLWMGKKLSKNQEERGKFHWDFVIEEMVWLSGVVQQELKTKKMLAKKCAVMVQKHFKDKEMAEIRAEKAREANLRRIASLMAREVKNFWGDVNKLFEYRLKIKLDAKKKEALDQHLNYIVDKTEKYSTLLAESLADNTNSVPTSSGAPSRAESVMSEEEADNENDGEYNPDVDSDDDEETIEKEEEDNKAEKNHEKEINELEDEAEVPIEELLKKYYPEQFGDIEVKRKDSTEERKEDAVKIQEEDKEPKDETETATEELVEKIPEQIEEENATMEEDSGRSRRKRKPIDIAEVEAKIKAEEAESKPKSVEEAPKDKTEEDKLEEYASLAATFQPTGNTLDTTTVKTKVPFLLKHTLREYQHIGLDWMVSLFERNLNGILADEMGLGKTIQTIAFLAHLASDRENWGPHLIVVPTSVMLNWEMEIKKWCPGFKVLVYYGSQKERRLKRVGWTKQNAFHICITSYKLVIQDHSSFRRFKWQYFILDEAQHIKNFKSQRWQLLLNFTSVGRLLLTGTPLQNNLMELWSLMHFLMPHVFESHRDFKEWFSNPMTGMVEGNMEYNNELVKRLHKVLRPFILRRLKSEVEKQLPKKYEHLVKCPLSKRQRYLYDDFMSRAKTKEILASGNLLSVINVLMQLRKCCNHPNLFEPRPTLSPFVMTGTDCVMPANVTGVLDYQPLSHIHLDSTPLMIAPLESKISGYTWFRYSSLKCPPITMLNPPDIASHLSCPKNKIRMEVRNQMPPVVRSQLPVDNASFCQLEQIPSGHVIPVRMVSQQSGWLWQSGLKFKSPQGYFQLSKAVADEGTKKDDYDLVSNPWHPPLALVTNTENTKDSLKRKATDVDEMKEEMLKHGRGIFNSGMFEERISTLSRSPSKLAAKRRKIDEKLRLQELEMPEMKRRMEEETLSRRKRNLFLNDRRADMIPMYGTELTQLVQTMHLLPALAKLSNLEALTCKTVFQTKKHEISCYDNSLLPSKLIFTVDNILSRLQSVFSQFIMYIPAVHVPIQPLLTPVSTRLLNIDQKCYPGDFLQTRFQISTPDTRLIQYDCGKLQVLAGLLHKLQAGGHRALIFTQMTKMLDVLEAFLNYHGYVYMRLDGSTKVETRQCLMERFNNDKKYFIFILSTRSGGVGINLTGADTVIFYDSDWNPTMDAQAQDRCHRIGQTRDVHIYRLVSERTVEENIIKKANQKKLLGDLAIEGGNFTTAFFKKSTINDLFNDNTALTEDQLADEEDQAEAMKKKVGAFETALATAEEDHDVQATKQARAEENEDENDFKEEEDQFNSVLSELKSVERYALKHLEWENKDFAKEQLDFAQAEIEARKEEFDAGKLDELTQEMREELGLSSEEEDDEGGQTDEASEAAEEDYAPDGNEDDDENTIEKDEKQEQKDEFEINMLENDAEIPVEDLIKLYYPDQWRQMQEQGEGVGVVEVGTNGSHEGGPQVNGRRSTRSRGNVEINLWELENPEEQLRSTANNHQA